MGKLEDQLVISLTNKIYYEWFKAAGDRPHVDVTPSSSQGATNALFFDAKIDLNLFIKINLNDAEKENKGYRCLYKATEKATKEAERNNNNGRGYSRHLLKPLLIDDQKVLIILPRTDGKTFHELIQTHECNPNFIKTLYQDFLEQTGDLFSITKSVSKNLDLYKYSTDRVGARLLDLERKLTNGRIRLRNKNIKINNDKYGKLGEVIDNFQQKMNNLNPAYYCTIHGDEHPKNILVYDDAILSDDKTGWVIIDYVTASQKGDWTYSLAKMMQWWEFYFVLENAKSDPTLRQKLASTFSVDDDAIHCTFDMEALNSSIPSICNELREQVLIFAENQASVMEDQENWKQRLKLNEFAVVFGSIANHADNLFAIPIMMHFALQCLELEKI